MPCTKAILLIPLLLGACVTDTPIGSAVTNNVVAQTVDLNPRYAGVTMEGSNADRSANAYKRYLKGAITPLQRPDGKTSVVGGAAAAIAPQ